MHGFGAPIARDLRAMLDSYILQLFIFILLTMTLAWGKDILKGHTKRHLSYST
jgi:hypothetical protein